MEMKREVIGVVRLDENPPYTYSRSNRVWYADTKKIRIPDEDFENDYQGNCTNYKFSLKKEKVVVPEYRQPLWYVYKDTLGDCSWAFARFHKMVPLNEWKQYPFYSGVIFDKR